MLGVLLAAFLTAASPSPAAVTFAAAPKTQSTSLLGDWQIRVLDNESGRPERFEKLSINEAENGRLVGRFSDPLFGEFREASVETDGDVTALRFKTARGLLAWLPPQEGSGSELHHEARFASGRFTGMATDESGKTVLRWYARRSGEDDDYGALLAGRTFRLKLINEDDDFCRETYSFRDDGAMTSKSGDEILEEIWRVAVDEKGAKSLVTRILSTNGKPDCQGDASAKAGDERTLPILFFNGGGYAVCGSDRGLSCYGVVSEVVAPRLAVERPKLPPNVVPMPIRDDELRSLRENQCERGNGAACLDLSNLQMTSRGGAVDKASAVESARKGCALGVKDSCFAYASGLYVGAAGEKDLPGALEIFDTACERDHARSCMMSARLRLSFKPAASAAAAPFAHRGCDLGNSIACGDEALALIDQKSSAERPERMRAMLHAGCDADPAAGHCGFLGGYLIAGTGGPVDLAQARMVYQRGCNAGDGGACYGFAELIWRGDVDGLKKKDARSYFEFACDKQVEPACKRVGRSVVKDQP